MDFLSRGQTYGFVKKEKKSQNCETQTPEADEGKPPQEAFTLQELKVARRAAALGKAAWLMASLLIFGSVFLAEYPLSALGSSSTLGWDENQPEGKARAQEQAQAQAQALEQAKQQAPARLPPPVHRPPPVRPEDAEVALIFDPSYREPSKDLELPSDPERQSDAYSHFMAGILAESDDDTEKTYEEFQKAFALDPKNTELALKLTSENLRRGKIQEAIKLLKDTIKINPNDSSAYLALAFLYYNYLNRTSDAEALVNEALKLNPKDYVAYEYAVEIQVGAGNTAKAAQILKDAAAIDTNDANYWLHLANLYSAFYLKDNAVTSRENIKKISNVFEKALLFCGNDPQVIEETANFYAQTKQLDIAIKLYQRAKDLDPDNADIVEKLARLFILNGQENLAVATLEKALQSQSQSPQESTYEMLAEIYRGNGQPQLAIKQYEQCLNLDPSNPNSYSRLYELYLDPKIHDTRKAVDVCAKAVEVFPDDLSMGERLGIAYTQNKQYPEALSIFEKTLIAAQKDDPDLLEDGSFYFRYASAAQQAGQYEKAAELLKRGISVAKDPDIIAQASNFLGFMWIERGENLEEAKSMVQKALNIHPDNGSFLDSLGWYYFRKNQFDLALTELLKAEQKMQDPDSSVLEHIGDTYLKLNNNSKAVSYWEKALKAAKALSSDDEDRSRIQKKIEDVNRGNQKAVTSQ